jgi:acyl-CoA-binding protein
MADLIQKEFNTATQRIKTEKRKDGKDPTNEEKLKLYSLFKQATIGDVTGYQPWAVQVEARAKWYAWNSIKGMSKEDAMKEYIEQVKRHLG